MFAAEATCFQFIFIGM